jgi:hypothetical protein
LAKSLPGTPLPLSRYRRAFRWSDLCISLPASCPVSCILRRRQPTIGGASYKWSGAKNVKHGSCGVRQSRLPTTAIRPHLATTKSGTMFAIYYPVPPEKWEPQKSSPESPPQKPFKALVRKPSSEALLKPFKALLSKPSSASPPEALQKPSLSKSP